MQTNNNVPERDNTSDIRYHDVDYEATLWVCGYTVDEATTHDNVVVRCRICGAPMMRAMSDIEYHPEIQRNPCGDCRKAFAALRRIMWGDREQGRKNAEMRKWYAANLDEIRAYAKHRNYALEGTRMDKSLYLSRQYYVTRGRGRV